MKILIVEDEQPALDKLIYTVQQLEMGAEIIGTTGSIRSSVHWLKSNPAPDIILLDIELSDGQSFEIFRQVEVESAIIFITSYDEYAIKAFKLNSIDYLLKPVQKDELKKAFEKYTKYKAFPMLPVEPASSTIQKILEQMHAQINIKPFRKRFLVKHMQKLVPVEAYDIACFFIYERTTFFKTFSNKKFIVDYSIEELEAMLEPAEFFRVSRSVIISAKSILQVNDYVNSRIQLTLQPEIDMSIIVSRDRVYEFKKWIGN